MREGGVPGTLGRLALACWVGGGALYTFVLTPAVFRAYGRDRAGEVVGTMMPHYFAFMLAAVAVAGVALILATRGQAGPPRTLRLGLVFAALLAQGVVAGGVYPRILAVKAQVASFERDPDDPARRSFRRLHGASMALNLFVILDGALLLLQPARPTRRP